MKLILAIDSSEVSGAAVAAIGNFSLGRRDEIIVVSIVDMSLSSTLPPRDAAPANSAEFEEISKTIAVRTAENACRSLSERLGASGVKVRYEIRTGSPERRIVELAEEIGADLIVIGSHGYNRWERLLIGSVSDAVVHHAPCSVFVARAK